MQHKYIKIVFQLSGKVYPGAPGLYPLAISQMVLKFGLPDVRDWWYVSIGATHDYLILGSLDEDCPVSVCHR